MSATKRLYADADGKNTAHRLVVELAPGGIYGDIVCESDRDAYCRTTCRASECEEGCVDPEVHPRERVDYCNIVEFIDDEGWQDTYDGPRTLLRSGWIVTYWNGYCYEWCYVGDEPR
jgi:hypothetical protein